LEYGGLNAPNADLIIGESRTESNPKYLDTVTRFARYGIE
jgi:hypothetical protein